MNILVATGVQKCYYDTNRLSTERFIPKQGNCMVTNTIIYTEYISTKSKVTIVCLEHGPFEQNQMTI